MQTFAQAGVVYVLESVGQWIGKSYRPYLKPTSACSLDERLRGPENRTWEGAIEGQSKKLFDEHRKAPLLRSLR
jgi:hypothetical protein